MPISRNQAIFKNNLPTDEQPTAAGGQVIKTFF
jgi:hypothetical protein